MEEQNPAMRVHEAVSPVRALNALKPNFPWFLGFLGIAATQAALSWVGYLQAAAAFGISPVWPAAGFAVAVTILYGYRVVPALWVGMTLADYMQGGNIVASIWLGIATTAGAALGAFLVGRFVPRLAHADTDWSEAALFLLLTAVVATALTGIVGSSGLALLGILPVSAMMSTALSWWIGDAVGVITVAPALFAWLTPERRAAGLGRPVEFSAVILLTVVAAAAGYWLPTGENELLQGIPGVVLVLPFLVWAALRFGLVGAATSILVVAAAATSASTMGIGAFGGGSAIDIYRLQFLLGIVAATTLLLGATASRKDHLQEEAKREADFIRSIAENLPGAVFRRRLAPDGQITYPYMAGRFAEEFGLTAINMGYALDGTGAEGAKHLHEQDLARLHHELRESARTMEPLETELRFMTDAGDIRWIRSISRPHRNNRGTVFWDGILLEVTEEKHQRAQAEYLARHDPLTGLMNRNGLHEILTAAFSRANRQGTSVAVCIVDLDGFKKINDTHGHAAGDRILGATADRLRSCMRLEDIKARLGGDEFVVVQTDVQLPSLAVTACQRLATALPEPVWHEGEAIYPHASIGIALYHEDGGDIDAVFAAADEAMYSAKARGDGEPVLYNPGLGQQSRARSRLTEELRDAIEHDGLEVHYQPQIHVPTGRVSGLEALVRWQHPEHGWLSPGWFVPLAEETGLVSGLDQFVLARALADFNEWDAQGIFDGAVAVNLSGASLRSPEHRDELARLIEASRIDPKRLDLELTETTLIQASDERISEGLRSLASLGIHFSADDFGTGYGSLTYLRALPITRIKIDRSFVQGAPWRPEDAEIVRALLQLALNLGLQVIAEGVENDTELDLLQGMGCEFVQGFHFARPMPRADLETYLRDRQMITVSSAYSGHLF